MNTSNLTPVSELAKNLGLIHILYGEHYPMNFSNEKLESFRQAVIADYVKSLEPVAWETYNDAESLREITWADECVISKQEAESIAKPLYDLSEFKDTK